MATVTRLGTPVFTTTAGNKTLVATPAVGDLPVVVTGFTANSAGEDSLTDNNADGLGSSYTKVFTGVTSGANNSRISIYVRNAKIGSATSTTWTAAQSSSGGGLCVLVAGGMTKVGAAAVRGSGSQSSQGSGTTPAPVLTQAALTTNPVIGGVINATNPATLTQRSSPAYAEAMDSGYTSPAAGMEVMYISSGETSATITWGGTSASAFGSVAVELDSSASTSYTLTSVSKNVSLTGGSDVPKIGRRVASISAAITYTGGADGAVTGRLLGSLGGTIGFIGGNQTLTYTPGTNPPTNYALDSTAANITFTGSPSNSATVVYNYKLQSTAPNITFTGGSNTLTYHAANTASTFVIASTQMAGRMIWQHRN